jgi:hypothetical protein
MKTSGPVLFNSIINLFWTILAFLPIVMFWIKYPDTTTLWVSIALSLPLIAVSESASRKLQLSDKRKFYERLGVKFAQSLSQNGKLVNALIKRTGHADHYVVRTRNDLRRYRTHILGYQRFHLACLIFFFIGMIRALILGASDFFIGILIMNVVYNVYPLLIQQFNTLRTKNA